MKHFSVFEHDLERDEARFRTQNGRNRRTYTRWMEWCVQWLPGWAYVISTWPSPVLIAVHPENSSEQTVRQASDAGKTMRHLLCGNANLLHAMLSLFGLALSLPITGFPNGLSRLPDEITYAALPSRAIGRRPEFENGKSAEAQLGEKLEREVHSRAGALYVDCKTRTKTGAEADPCSPKAGERVRDESGNLQAQKCWSKARYYNEDRAEVQRLERASRAEARRSRPARRVGVSPPMPTRKWRGISKKLPGTTEVSNFSRSNWKKASGSRP